MAVIYDMLEEVLAQIQALKLPGLAPANVLIQKVISTKVVDMALPEGQRFPCILIGPWGRETFPAGSNVRDDVGYPIAVAIIASEVQEKELARDKQLENFDQYLGWRETLRRAFIGQRLTSTLGQRITIEPLDITDRAAWEQLNLWVSGMVLRIEQRESRA